ncbi:hypothetical protein CLOM_g15656 [Closterium sp. NIES-68]|nr:hypothetical protein CLOM_g15656 [Closterium sp. NIES-68]GJP79365.1 hypothetical protein CLOP_g9607 [Closterium sp. NIES-67]
MAPTGLAAINGLRLPVESDQTAATARTDPPFVRWMKEQSLDGDRMSILESSQIHGRRQSVDGDPMAILESSQQTLIVRTDPPFVRWMKEQQAADVTRGRDARMDDADEGGNDDVSDSDEYYTGRLETAGRPEAAQTERLEREAEAGREGDAAGVDAGESDGEDSEADAEADRRLRVHTRNCRWSDTEMLELAAAVLYCRDSGAVTRRACAKGSGYWGQVRRVMRRGNPAWARLPSAMAQQWKRMKARYDDDQQGRDAEKGMRGKEMRGEDQQIRDEGEQRQRGSNNADELVSGNASAGKERRMAGGKMGGNSEWYEYVQLYYATGGKLRTGTAATTGRAATAGRADTAGRAATAAPGATAAAAAAGRPCEMPPFAFPESVTPPTWPDAAATAAAAAITTAAATAASSLLPLPAPALSSVSPFATSGSDKYLLSLQNSVTPVTSATVAELTAPQPTIYQPTVHRVRGIAPGGLTAGKEQKGRKERRSGRGGVERIAGGARVLTGGASLLTGGARSRTGVFSSAALGERVSAALGAVVRNACLQFEELSQELLENACAQFEELSRELADEAAAQIEEILAEAGMAGPGGKRRRR